MVSEAWDLVSKLVFGVGVGEGVFLEKIDDPRLAIDDLIHRVVRVIGLVAINSGVGVG